MEIFYLTMQSAHFISRLCGKGPAAATWATRVTLYAPLPQTE